MPATATFQRMKARLTLLALALMIGAPQAANAQDCNQLTADFGALQSRDVSGQTYGLGLGDVLSYFVDGTTSNPLEIQDSVAPTVSEDDGGGSTTSTGGLVTIFTNGGPNTFSITCTPAISSNADLSSLSLSVGSLSPGFASNTTNYSVSVPNGTTVLTATPTVADPGATVTVQGAPVGSGTPSGNIAVTNGMTINVVVTAQDTMTTKTYSVTVTVAAAPALSNADLSSLSLSVGTLSPAFASNTLTYTLAIPSGTTVTVTPTVADPLATMTVQGDPVASGSPVQIAIAASAITIVVTAQDMTLKTYTVALTRQSAAVVPPQSQVLRNTVRQTTPAAAITASTQAANLVSRNISAGFGGFRDTSTDGAQASDAGGLDEGGDDSGSAADGGEASNSNRRRKRHNQRRGKGGSYLGMGTGQSAAPATGPSRLMPWMDGAVSESMDTSTGGWRHTLVAAGLSYLAGPGVIVGAFASYEDLDVDQEQSGNVDGSGTTGGMYLGWMLSRSIRLDAAVALTWLDYEAMAGTASGKLDASRWMFMTRLSGNHVIGNWTLTPSVAATALQEEQDAYTDSLGTAHSKFSFSSGRADVGLEAAYAIRLSHDRMLAPYAGLYADYYFGSNEGDETVSELGIGDGWAARPTAGLRVMGNDWAIDLGGELGNLGGEGAQFWTGRLNGRLQF